MTTMQVDDKRELLEVGREHLERDQATKRGGCALAPIEELDPEVVVAGSWDSIESRYLMLARGTLITRTTTA